KVRPGWIYNIHKLRDGGVLYAHQSGVIELDAAGKEVWSVPLKGMENWGRVEPLGGGRHLVPQGDGDRVLEVNRAGQIVWEVKASKATSALRLSSGHTLFTDCQNNRVVEVDRGGKVVQSWPTPGRPFRVRRY